MLPPSSLARLAVTIHHWGRATCCAASHHSPLMWHCLPPAWGWTGSPRFSGVNCKLWIWRVSAKRLFWQLHISTSRNLAWLGMGFPLYKHRLLLNIGALIRKLDLAPFFSWPPSSPLCSALACLPGESQSMWAAGQLSTAMHRFHAISIKITILPHIKLS